MQFLLCNEFSLLYVPMKYNLLSNYIPHLTEIDALWWEMEFVFRSSQLWHNLEFFIGNIWFLLESYISPDGDPLYAGKKMWNDKRKSW